MKLLLQSAVVVLCTFRVDAFSSTVASARSSFARPSILKSPIVRLQSTLRDKDEEQAEAAAIKVDDVSNEVAKISLEEKMKQWESTETKSTPPPERTDAFDIGLYIAFPFMVLASLAFAIFPFIMDKIDVSSVGPPPTL